MPSPNLSKAIAIARFQSFGITLPPVPPAGGSIPGLLTTNPAVVALAQRPGAAIAGAVRSSIAPRLPAGVAGTGGAPPAAPTGTPLTQPPALFRAASNALADVDLQKAMHDAYTELFDALTEALRFAWERFRRESFFSGLQINAVTALGAPGCLRGPVLYDAIRMAPTVAGWSGWKTVVRDGFAEGIDKSWSAWQRSVTVPGLPWYPAFAAWPGPVAPPMPNVPTPLIACMSIGLQSMHSGQIGALLTDKLTGKLDYHAQFASAMADMVGAAFSMWLPSQMVTGVLGKGPVPTFAPPYVPVGPVVMGDNIAAPGHLAA